ncbi:MAG: NAD(P)H-dependent glycerol-3-phosphate dehydrogenase [Bacteroidales bacterium]
MPENKMQIVFVGSGAIATSLGNILAAKPGLEITLLSIEEDVVSAVNQSHTNPKYFPNVPLNHQLKASGDKMILQTADLIFLAIPSVAIVDYLHRNEEIINKKAVLVNLAKGFGRDFQLIPDCISEFMSITLSTMKGPSFARDIINGQPTGFTIASDKADCFPIFQHIFKDTIIHLDFSTDVPGVEYASILKNIYAIIIGIVDANFDSPNLRSLVISKSINEMRSIIEYFDGNANTLFNYCGFGDFSLTALNDLSRNRTLGLLIGKGFFTRDISEKVVLEGRIAAQIFYERLSLIPEMNGKYPLMSELYLVFNSDYEIKSFVDRILRD